MEQTFLATVQAILAEPPTNEPAALDELTGTYAVSYGVRRLREETERAQRYRHPICCFVVDLDDLVTVNETHGPARGDRVLQDVGTILRHGARATDLVARLEGDQFLLITPRLNEQEAQAQAERMRQKIARHRFPIPGGPALTLTASFGVASLRAEDRGAVDLLMRALDAVVAAKQSGGNQVTIR